MKNFLVLLLLLVLVGCASMDNLVKLRYENRKKLMEIKIGMTKEQAMAIMGTKSLKDDAASYQRTADNPYRSETLQGKDKTLEAVFYYTHIRRLDAAITDDELTPLVFDNGKLIGWGWGFLNNQIKKYGIRPR